MVLNIILVIEVIVILLKCFGPCLSHDPEKNRILWLGQQIVRWNKKFHPVYILHATYVTKGGV